MNKKLSMSVFVVIAGACGSNEPLSQTVDTTSPSEFCRAAASEQCATMYSCLTDAEKRAIDLPDSEDECERMFESACEDGAADCGSAFSFAPASAAACLDEMERAVCNDAAEPWLDAVACENLCERSAGAFDVGWTFSNGYGCYDVSAEEVVLVAEGPGGRFESRFVCSDYSGRSSTLPLGEYNIHLELFDQYKRKIYSGIGARGRLDKAVVDLGTITIPVGQ